MQAALAVYRPGLDNDLAVRSGVVETLQVILHPSKFSKAILERIAAHPLLPERGWIIDPFAGVGGVHQLTTKTRQTVGVEIETEWAEAHLTTVVGDSRYLHELFPEAEFDACVTSPCLAQHHRVLTEDLRWVSVGDIRVGDRLMGFDEHGRVAAVGRNARRRWCRTEVIRSVPRQVECVRVILANGDEVITTPEHPWLTSRYSYGGTLMEWVPSSALMGHPALGRTRGHQQGARQPYYVQLQVAPWNTLRSYEAGWVAGIFDGEGSLSLGVHGSPKLLMCQVEGTVLDRTEEWLNRLGLETSRIVRKSHVKWQPEHRQPVTNLYISGGFPGIMRALGQLRPARLLEKWATLDVSTRTVEAERVVVVAVEPAGWADIQEIETDTGTYIGEGYLHHNCYGNRFADHHNAKDGSRRRSYTHDLRALTGNPLRMLHPGNTGLFPEGRAYWNLHAEVWTSLRRVLAPGAPVFLNVSNFIRSGVEVDVCGGHLALFSDLGFSLVDSIQVGTPRMRAGQNYQARVAFEQIYVLLNSNPVVR